MSGPAPMNLAFFNPQLWRNLNSTHAAMIAPSLPFSPASPKHWLTDFLLAALLVYLMYLSVSLLRGFYAEITTKLAVNGPVARSTTRDAMALDFIGTTFIICIAYMSAVLWVALLGVGENALGRITSVLFVAASVVNGGVFVLVLALMLFIAPLAAWQVKKRAEEEEKALREAEKMD